VARFLIDESLPRAVGRALADRGHDVVDVRDAGMRGWTDGRIAARAVAEKCIVVAGDLDFANALRFPPGTHPGIVVLRAPDGWNAAQRTARILAAIQEVGPQALVGTIAIIEPDRVRIFGGTRS
jgi:predicted nuclease of predicted toxin-antitoxin system